MKTLAQKTTHQRKRSKTKKEERNIEKTKQIDLTQGETEQPVTSIETDLTTSNSGEG